MVNAVANTVLTARRAVDAAWQPLKIKYHLPDEFEYNSDSGKITIK